MGKWEQSPRGTLVFILCSITVFSGNGSGGCVLVVFVCFYILTTDTPSFLFLVRRPRPF